jgi:hypothetical protein
MLEHRSGADLAAAIPPGKRPISAAPNMYTGD